MNLSILPIAKSLNKAYLKREQTEVFKANLARMFECIRTDEHEEHLPTPPATDAQQAPIIERVRKILAAPDSTDVPQLETEIDRLVYALYGLTEEEIAVVEGK